MQHLDPQFRRHPRQYLAQAGLATITLAAVLVLEDALSNVALITAIAASAFLVFIGPGSRLGTPRRVIGGHLTGCCVGLAFAATVGPLQDLFGDTTLVVHLVAALAVGAGIVAMGATDTEHPPAAGTVLGLVIGGDALVNAGLVMLAVVLINAARALLRRWLVDLL